MKKTLSEYLVEQGLSQQSFADMIGMSQGSVWRMTRGRQLPRREKRNRILDVTNGQVDPWDDPSDDHKRVA